MKRAIDLDVRLVTEVTSLDRLAPEWSDLWSRSRHLSPFQRPEWLLPWVHAFRPQEISTIEVRQRERLVGLAPMFIHCREGERVLVPIGAGVSDYLDWLVDFAMQAEVVWSMLSFLDVNCASFDRVEIFDLPKTSTLLNLFTTASIAEYDTCAILRWDQSVQRSAQVLSRHQRRNLRNARNRSQRRGSVAIELANHSTLPEFLDALLRLHRARWTRLKMPGVLDDKAVQQFHREATEALLNCGVLRLYALRLDGVIIAVLYAMEERDMFYCYVQGFDPRYGDLSPGAQILAAVIEDAVWKGKCAVDFLRGRETYKYSWGAKDEPTYRVILPKSHGRGIPIPERLRVA